MVSVDRYKPQTHIMYLDANNLYGYAISQSLPFEKFEWVPQEQFEQIDWLSQEADQTKGYFLECDLEYPQEFA